MSTKWDLVVIPKGFDTYLRDFHFMLMFLVKKVNKVTMSM